MNQNQEKISIQSIINQIQDRKNDVDCYGLFGSERAYLVSRLYLKHKKQIIIVVSSPKDAEIFIDDLHFFLKSDTPPLLYFPPYNISAFKYISYHNETAARRISILYKVMESEMPSIVVTTVDALLQKNIPKQEIIEFAELVMEGEEIDRDILVRKLISGGYVRATIVEEVGDFCIRGGILDIFSSLYPDPIRMEWFGDTVESLRFFSASSQRTIKNIQEVVILPAREAILKKEQIVEIISRIRERASVLNIPVTKVRELVDHIKKEGVFPGIESLIPMIYPKLDTFFDYIPDSALFVRIEPAELEKASVESKKQIDSNYMSARNESRICVEPDSLYLKWDDVKEKIAQKKPLTVKTLPLSKGSLHLVQKKQQTPLRYHFSVKDNNAIITELKSRQEKENLFLPLANWINDNKESGYTTILVCHGNAQADRLKSLLLSYNIQIQFINNLSDIRPDIKRSKGPIYICSGQLSKGFIWPDESLAIITEDEIFGSKHRRRRKPKHKIRKQLLAFEDLKRGDLVVHNEHGIGQYEGLVKLKLDGTANDYLLIIYKDGDKLYLPVDRMSMVQKYIGMDGITPILDKMGGRSWKRVKERVKKSAEKIAGELLKLYAERKVKKGYAYKKPDSYFKDFEAGFPYEETYDQLKAVEDVLHDMMEPASMDRLVCGDVGYGKTEVALRASFMAVNEGKQVAVLVPTTVLAEQHFTTFSHRFERYPVNVACLSRFRSLKEQRVILNDLKSGKIDIVIGTHRLLSKDIYFNDIGLLVIDEEQRFGVKHKEKLKKIRNTVDVLALTATPIPRTLHMSLMGMRDISIIATPPEHRHAIMTYICEFDDAVISDAIRNELKRGGQIFFVHNNINSIWSITKHLQKLTPEVRLNVAHGRMNDNELEKVMLSFVNKEIDMLVCTTIIESGLDIPSANTIMVNWADRFGLAQMYQLRGRVGRADDQAFAYLFISNESTISTDAQKRLKVLMEHSDLGAGFQIAMSDLKIRGGGTILGASQSGHIAAVGYDMFLKLMENSISYLKGEPVFENLEPEINVTMSTFLPESFISDIDQRLSVYRSLAKMKDLNEIADFKKELVDRFGALPKEASNLLLKIMLKVMSIKAGVKRLDLSDNQLLLSFSETHQQNPFGIVEMIVSDKDRFEFTPNHVFKAKLSKTNVKGRLIQTKKILKEISQRVNS